MEILLQKSYISESSLFSLELYTRLEQYNTMLKTSNKQIWWPSWVFWSIGFSNNTNSRTPTFKHSHITIKLGDWRWSSTFITIFSHISTPHHFRFNFNSFTSRNWGFWLLDSIRKKIRVSSFLNWGRTWPLIVGGKSCWEERAVWSVDCRLCN